MIGRPAGQLLNPIFERDNTRRPPDAAHRLRPLRATAATAHAPDPAQPSRPGLRRSPPVPAARVREEGASSRRPVSNRARSPSRARCDHQGTGQVRSLIPSLIHIRVPRSATGRGRVPSRPEDQRGQRWTVFLNPEKRKVGGSAPPLTTSSEGKCDLGEWPIRANRRASLPGFSETRRGSGHRRCAVPPHPPGGPAAAHRGDRPC
jgi:hypothetical protein